MPTLSTRTTTSPCAAMPAPVFRPPKMLIVVVSTSGTPAPGDVDYIVERMQHCPVSINLKDVADSRTAVDFIAAS